MLRTDSMILCEQVREILIGLEEIALFEEFHQLRIACKIPETASFNSYCEVYPALDEYQGRKAVLFSAAVCSFLCVSTGSKDTNTCCSGRYSYRVRCFLAGLASR